MKEFMLSIRGNYLIVPIVLLFSLFAMFLDSKINDKKYNKDNYFKVGFLVILVSSFVVSVNLIECPVIEEEIIKGAAPF